MVDNRLGCVASQGEDDSLDSGAVRDVCKVDVPKDRCVINSTWPLRWRLLRETQEVDEGG